MELIYRHIFNIINSISDKFAGKISSQRYEENEPDNVGVILMSSRSDEECISGELEWESLKLELHVTCKNEAEDIFENMEFLRKFADAFENSESTVEGLQMIWAKHLGAKARPSYTNSYGLQVVKTVIDFNYLLSEDD